MASRRIDYTIGFKVNKSELNAITNSFREIKNLTPESYQLKFGVSGNLREVEKELDTIKGQVDVIEKSYRSSFDSKLGVLNLQKFNAQLAKGGVDSNHLFQSLSKIGKEDVFANIIKGATTANLNLKQTTSFLDKMGETLTSTVRWGISSRLMNSFVGSVKGSFSYIKELDTSLNDIRIVTGKSADEMATFAKEANKAASSLGSTTKTYTDASLIYFQQGLSDSEVKARAETTIKTANVTGQTGEEVSEQLTAVWNGYKVSAAETELYVDKLAAVASTTASNLEELSTGMSKVASAANVMGVDVDQLNGMLSTAISVTRQAPESVGTAFKTIFARIGDIEAGNGEVTLGQYTEKMKEIGFNVLDANNKLRNQGDVIEEIGNKWNTLSREQQIALAQTMAGARQYNNLLALFDNWNMYTKAVETSRDATGTLQKQQDVYMESTEAHLKELTAAQEQFQASILDPKTINDVTSALTAMFNVFAKGVDALGGGGGALLNFGSILTRVFSKQIARSITPVIKNFKDLRSNAKSLEMVMSNIKNLENYNDYGSKTAVPRLRAEASKIQPYLRQLNSEEQQKVMNLLAEKVTADSKVEALQGRKKETVDWLNRIAKAKAFQGQKIEEVTESDDLNSKKVKEILESRQTAFDRYKTSFTDAQTSLKQVMTSSNSDITIQKEAISELLNKVQVMKLEFDNLDGLELYSEDQVISELERIKKIEEEALKAQDIIDKALKDREEESKKSQQEEEEQAAQRAKEEEKQATQRARDREIERRRKKSASINENVDERLKEQGWEETGIKKGAGSRSLQRKIGNDIETKGIDKLKKEEAAKIQEEKNALAEEFKNPFIATVDLTVDSSNIKNAVNQSVIENENIKQYSENFSKQSQEFLNTHMQAMAELADQATEIGKSDSAGLEDQESALQILIKNAQQELDNFNNSDETLEVYKEEEAEKEKERIKEIIEYAEEALQKIKDAEVYNKKQQKEKTINERVNKKLEKLVKVAGTSEEDPEYQNPRTGRKIKKSKIQEYETNKYNRENNLNVDTSPSVENTTQVAKSSADISEMTSNIAENCHAINEALGEVGDTANATAGEVQNLDGAMQDAADNSASLGENSNDIIDAAKIQATVESVVQLTSNLGMGFSIMNNIAELPNIWQSQEDGATKAAQTLFNFAQTAIPAVVSGINTIQTANTALQASMGWIGIIGMIIGAVVGIGQAIVNWQENERKARIENNKAIIEENKLRQEEIDSNTALYDSYVELEKKYKNGDISKKELLSSTGELIDAYDIENGKLYQLTGQYDKLAEAIKKKRLEEAKDKRDTAKSNLDASRNILNDTIHIDDLNKFKNASYIAYDEDYNQDNLIKLQEIFDSEGIKTIIEENDNKAYLKFAEMDKDFNTAEQIENFKNVADKLKNTKNASLTPYISYLNSDSSVMENVLTKLAETDISEYLQYSSEANQAEFEFQIQDRDIDSINSYEEYAKALKTLQNSMDISSDEFYSFVEGLGTEYSSIYAAAERLKEKTTDEKLKEKIDSLSKEDLAIAVALDIDEKTSVKNLEDGIAAAKMQISPEDLTVMTTIRTELGTDGLGDKIQENVIGYDSLTKGIENRSLFRQNEAVNAIGSDYVKNNQTYLSEMLDSDTRNQLSNQYQQNIKQLYEDYTYLDNYNRAKTKGADINRDNVTMLELGLDPNDEEELKRITKLREEYFETWENGGGLKEGKDFEEFLEKVYGKDAIEGFTVANNYLDTYTQGLKKYGEELSSLEINNLVFDQIKEETNQILSNFDAIKTAGSLIGEGFVVAADDLEEFASKFPELLKDYEVLSDGSIKLSQEQVETTIGGIHEEQKAKAEAQIQELEIQKGLLQIRLDSIRKQKENTLKFLQGKISQEEYEKNAVKLANQYKKDLSDTLAKNDITNFEEVLAAQGVTIEDEIKNVDKLGETYAKLGAYASAALRGQDPGEWGASLADAVISKSDELNQDVLNSIGSTYNFDELTKGNKEALNKAFQEYKQEVAQETEAEDAIAEIDKEIVLLKSGQNASIDSINDGLGDQIDLLEDILDIYHDINNELTQIDNLLNKVNEEQDRLTGQDYINALNDENNLLDAQIAKLNKKKEIGKAEAAGLKDQLTGYGFIFNEDGTVANYESAMTANAQIVQDAQMSGDEDAAERAQEQYDQMKEALERYEEITLNEIPGYDAEKREAINRQIENNIKKFHYELDLHVNLNTLEKDFNTFQQNMLDDNDLAGKFNLQADYLFDSHAMSNITEQADEVQKIMGEIQKMENGQTSEIFGDNIAAAYEELETATKNLQDSTVEVKQAFDEALNTYLSMMDQLSEAMNEQQSLYDKVNGILEHRKNVISMVFGEDNYKEFDMYYQKQHENNIEAIEAARSSRDYWASVMEQEEEGSELWLKAKENWEASVDTLNSKVEDSISNLKAQYDNAIKLIFQKTNEQITNGKGLDYLKYEWDYIKEDSAQYLDNVDRSYQISKFSANIEKQINSSSSASAKKKLADFQQQELEMLENKDKLSQYDLDRSNKKLEILQAQIALEDAQNNKSSMRLRRDSQGNYSYQFVADTSAVEKAQEDLQNSIHDLYTLDKERLQATTDGYYNAWTKMQEELAAAMQTLQGEELEARVQQIKDHYQPLLEGYSKDITQANDNLSQSALANLSLFNDEAQISTDKIVDYLTGDETGSKKLETEFINSLKNVGVEFETNLPNAAKAGLPKAAEQVGLVQQALDSMFDNVLQEAENFRLKLGEIEQASGESFKDYTTNAGKAYEKTKQLVEYQGKLITQYKDKLGISRETLKKLEELSGKFSNIATNATNAAKAAMKLFNQKYTAKIDVTGFTDAIDALIEKLGEYTDKVGEITGYTGAPSIGSGDPSEAADTKSEDEDPYVGKIITWKGNIIPVKYGKVSLTDKEIYGDLLKNVHIPDSKAFAEYKKNLHSKVQWEVIADSKSLNSNNKDGYQVKNLKTGYKGWVSKNDIAFLDTGGYTGVWNSKQGKMAMLHEKELVLNAKDTENILSAVQLMRKQQDLLNALSVSAIAQKQAMLDRINARIAADISTAATDLNQNVHIEASFPNVRDSRQIEEAFDNLVNMAAQYANKKLL